MNRGEYVQAVKNLWRSPTYGLGLKAIAVVALLPGFFSLIGDAPPLGIYINGAIVGSMHALIAIGLILVYRSNRVVNFAQASLGATPVILAVLLMQRRDYPYLYAVLIAVVGSLFLGALVEFVFVRRFNNSPRLILTLATIGIAQFLGFFELGLQLVIRGDAAVAGSNSRLRTPFSEAQAEIGQVNFSGDHLVTVLLVLVLAAALGAFFRYTNIGMAVRASAENADRASLMGIPVRRIRTIVWMIAGLLSGIGVLQRTILIGNLPAGLTGATTLLYGLAPAVIARMQNIPVAIAAGLGIGIIDVGIFFSTRSATLSTALVLPLVVIALLLQRSKLSRSEDSGVESWKQVKEVRPVPDELINERSVIIGKWVVRAVAAALVLALPYLTGEGRTDLASVLIVYAIAGVSLVVLTGWAGQISLGQFAFVGVGAAVAGGLVANHGTDFVTALFVAGLVGAAFAVLIGLPAVRLPGLFLAVTTLAFAANTQYFFLQKQYFGWLLPKNGEFVERPVLWGRVDLTSDYAFYYTCLFVFVLAAASARSVRSHRSGRILMAVRDNPRAAQSYGISATRSRLAAFAISGFFAAVAGGLFAHVQGVVDPNQFSPAQSLQIFAMTVIGGLTSVGGALVGALYVLGFQYFLPDYSLLASGMGMLLLLLFFPGGLSELGINLRDAYLRRIAIKKNIHVPSLVADSLRNEDDDHPEPVDTPDLHELDLVDAPVNGNGSSNGSNGNTNGRANGKRKRKAVAATIGSDQ